MSKIDPLLKNKNYRRQHGRLIFVKPFDKLTGDLPKKPSAIRERLEPRWYDYTFIMTWSFRNTFERFFKLLNKKRQPLTILDLGCGYKPFAALMPRKSEIIGVDMSLNSYADVIADNHHLPFKANVFDAVIASEVLEHTANEYVFIKELRRVVKNNALVFISMPFVFPEHGHPYDFQRFTQYKLKELFKQDEIVYFRGSNNLISSVFVFINLFLRIMFGGLKIIYPIYFINNILALIFERLRPAGNPYLKYAFESCPIGYSMIVKIKK